MPTNSPQDATRGFVAAWFTLFLIWISVTASLELTQVVTGFLVTAGIANIATGRSRFWSGLTLSAERFGAALRYVSVFLKEMVGSNLSVLKYVYAGKVDIAPQVVSLPVKITGPRERLALTNTIALTPGTLAVDLVEDSVEIHVLDAALVPGAKDSVAEFETLLEKAIG